MESFTVVDLCGNARELETQLSNPVDVGTSLRSSLELTRQLPTAHRCKHTRAINASINKLASFGYFVRDMSETLTSIFMENLLKLAKERAKEPKHHPLGHLHFNGAGHTGTTLGTGDRSFINFALHGKYQAMLEEILEATWEEEDSLETLHNPRSWSTCHQSLKTLATAKGLASVFTKTVRDIEDSINRSNEFYEWRPRKRDTCPLQSTRWKKIESTFRLDLGSETAIADQILEHQAEWGRKHRMDWGKKRDQALLKNIASSPLPPLIAVDGSRREGDAETRNSAGAILFTSDTPATDQEWEGTEWAPRLARVKLLPKRTGDEDTDNDAGEVVAVSLAEEMLPPSLEAIIVADSTTSIGTYRTMQDGTIVSSRAFVRKIMSGCGKGNVGRVARNIAHWSVPTRDMIGSSAAMHHDVPVPETPFIYLKTEHMIHQCEIKEEEVKQKENEEREVCVLTSA